VDPARRLATADDLLSLPAETRAEVIAGTVIEKAIPSAEHGDAQFAIAGFVRSRFHRGPGGRWPGGWWILGEVEIEFGPHDIFRPDLAGWRRDRVPQRPTGRPVRLRPDWVCEVLSTSNAQHDLVTKFREYHRPRVGHYWVVDPDNQTLIVYRWAEPGYLAVLSAKRGETVRAEAFDAVELRVGLLFGEDPTDD
jgi:Uma2 family endonuclease